MALFGSGVEICSPPVQPVTLVSPTTVTNCTRAGIQAALASGGHIDFDCDGAVTIPIDTALQLSTTADTVLDGGGLVTLDGQGTSRILYKDWHNPETVGTVQVTVQNLRFINAKAPSGGSTGDHSGGAISVGHPGTTLHVINCAFENNGTTDITTADNQGGAIFVHNSYETVISGSTFDGNWAGNGGAFGGIATGLLVYNSIFTGNEARDNTAGGIVRGYGGAIHLDGVTNSYNPNSNKRVEVCGCTFEGNTAYRGGGATVVTVSDNKGTRATYQRSTFGDNEVYGRGGEFGSGGAIYHIEDDHAGGVGEDNLEISRCTFHDNRALRQGGAVWLYILGQGQIVNSTFEGNTTTVPLGEVGQGGAAIIHLGIWEITNVTFANNHAAFQGGALFGGSDSSDRSITLRNTVFYNNTLNYQTGQWTSEWQGYHTNRPMTDGGQSIQYPRYKPIWGNEVNNNITANPIYADPLLDSLADNGGFNETMALRAGSPAIDAGASPCLPTDQRGEARVGQCDIGAFEYIPARIAVSPASRAVDPGDVATYQVQHAGDITYTLSLSASSPSPYLTVSLSPATVAPSEVATLTVTDTHPGPTLMPGLWYAIPITGTGNGQTLTATARLLVGGAQVYLPLVNRGN
jgi:predicted outer membrane repeat protein